jgi:hypothetical protein
MRSASLLLIALVAGCANLSSADCGDAYATGARDGRLGATPQAQAYAGRCGRPTNDGRYNEGWRAGYAERPVPLW